MTDILVAGGGLAGAACATVLARGGRDVTLIEREAAPRHKICGEFLSAEAQATLRRLGLDVAALGGAVITHVRLVSRQRMVSSRLPFEGLGLTRRTLDEAMLAHAGAAGVDIRRGRAIRRIDTAAGLRVELDDAAPLAPRRLMLATGKHEARGVPRRTAPGRLVGFKTYFRLAPAQLAALAGHVELIRLPGGYAGLQMVEGGDANLCLLVEAALLRRVGGTWPDVLAYLEAHVPHLARRLDGAVDLLPAPLTIARVPYGFLHRAQPDEPHNLFRLGDQAAVIPSFTGDGMAIALHSALRAAEYVAAGADAAAYHERLRRDLIWQLRRAGAVHACLAAPALGDVVFTGARLFPAALAACAALTRVPAHVRRAPVT